MKTRDELVESSLLGALNIYITQGTPNERQLARLAYDLIKNGSGHPAVDLYIRHAAAQVLRGEHAWQ